MKVTIFLTWILLLTLGRGSADPVRTHVIPGVFIRYVPDEVVIYEETTPIFFHINFTFTRPQDYFIDALDHNCDKLERNSEFSAICLIEQYLSHNLDYFTRRLNQFQQALTNRVPKTLSVRNLAHTILTDRRFGYQNLTGIPVASTSTTTTVRPSPPVQQTLTVNPTTPVKPATSVVPPIFRTEIDNFFPTSTTESSLSGPPRPFSSEEDDPAAGASPINFGTPMDDFYRAQATLMSSGLVNTTRLRRDILLLQDTGFIGPRTKRQAALLGLAAGYIGTHIFNYFDPPTPAVDFKALYQHLQKNMDIQSNNTLRLADAIQLEHHQVEKGLAGLYTHFNVAMATQSQNLNAFRQSLRDGNLRSYLLTARVSEDTYRLLELNQYDKIQSDCINGRLSLVAVEPKALGNELLFKQKALRPLDRELVIPAHRLSAYYHHPLAKCSFNPDLGSIDIRLEVPIKPRNQRVRVAEIFSVPFFHSTGNDSQICHISHSQELVAIVNDQPLPISAADTSHCQLSKGICQYFPFGTSASSNIECVKAMFSRGPQFADRIQQTCHFTCRSTSPALTEISVVRLGWFKGKYQFAITLPSQKAQVRCDSKSPTPGNFSIRTEATPILGAFLIELTCGCVIFLSDSYPLIQPPYPCFMSSDRSLAVPRINILIPNRWANFNTTQQHIISEINQEILKLDGYENFHDAYNASWFHSDLVLNMTDMEHPSWDKFQIHFGYYSHLLTPSLLGIWIFLSSLFNLFLFYKYWKLSQQLIIVLAMIPKVRAAHPAEMEHKYYFFLVSLGVLAVIILVTLIMCCCIFCRRRRRLRLQCVPLDTQQEEPYAPETRTRVPPPRTPAMFYSAPVVTRPNTMTNPILKHYLR